MNTRPKFYTLEDMTQEDLDKLALERNTFAKEIKRLQQEYIKMTNIAVENQNIIDELEKDIDLELYKTRANDEYNKGLFNAFRYIKDELTKLKELDAFKEGKY